MTKRPKGLPRSVWFHMSRARRRSYVFLSYAYMADIVLPAREWFKVEVT